MQLCWPIKLLIIEESRECCILCKLDLEKAFADVNGEFLDLIMLKTSFGD